jgi:hypothetical protein
VELTGGLKPPAMIGDCVWVLCSNCGFTMFYSFYTIFLISFTVRIHQLLCYWFFDVWTILNSAFGHGLRDSVVVPWNWNSVFWNLFFTTIWDGTVGSLWRCWGSLLSIPDPSFQPHLLRSRKVLHLSQYSLAQFNSHCIYRNIALDNNIYIEYSII